MSRQPIATCGIAQARGDFLLRATVSDSFRHWREIPPGLENTFVVVTAVSLGEAL
jgi:hypothetical protein